MPLSGPAASSRPTCRPMRSWLATPRGSCDTSKPAPAHEQRDGPLLGPGHRPPGAPRGAARGLHGRARHGGLRRRPHGPAVRARLRGVLQVAVLHRNGARFDFVDIDERTYTMDPERLRSYLQTACVRDTRTGHVVSKRTGTAVTA